LKSEIVQLETNIADVKTEIAKYRKSILEIRRIKKALKTLNNKLKIINTLQANRKWPITLLDSINLLVIEKRMWLTNIRSQKSRITIKGIALDNKTVADFMTRLEKSNLFTDVNLQTVSRKKVLKYNLKGFSVTCKKKPKKKLTRARAKK
jgi:type IV pilus assembly protein PilN